MAFNFSSRGYKAIRSNIKPILGGTALFEGGMATGAGLMSRRKNAVAYFTNKSKSRIRWNTFPGGPILEGPTQDMMNLFRVGKSDKQSGVKLLAQLLKSGTVREVGKVPLGGI